jgi:hypothetical protein
MPFRSRVLASIPAEDVPSFDAGDMLKKMMTSKKLRPIGLALILLTIAGCSRSISNSGYEADRAGSNPFYKGELDAYDVLGIDPSQTISDGDLKAAEITRAPMTLRKGSAVMLVQSGAAFADQPMVDDLSRYYDVSSFSGVPLSDKRWGAHDDAKTPSYAKLLRLAAAKGGFDAIIVYWGVLESAREGLGTKAVSWVPIIGGVIPDETQHLRLRVMLAVIDAHTGQWSSLQVAPPDDTAISNDHSRAVSDQRQVELLKTAAYQAATNMVVAKFSR